jgi:nucleotide-binding universal stress UspA family protein
VVHAWSLYGESLLAHGRAKLPPERFQTVREHERAKRQRWLEALIDDYRSTLDENQARGFQPKLELLHGDPTVVIPQVVRELDADVLGIGTVSRSGLGGLLIGNTAEAIVNRVDCTVVTLKPEGFISPLSTT